jgi:predicted SAM-dependent methyltransferase
MRNWLKSHAPSKLLSVFRWADFQYMRVCRVISPRSLPSLPGRRVNLHLGCGAVDYPGFINVDARPSRHVHYCRPVNDLKPFRDRSVDFIYVSHCLEHIRHADVNDTLAEWYRVLKPNGTLRLGVPDFDQLLRIYQASGNDIESIQLVLMGGQDYPQNTHYCTFTQASLTNRLKAVVFRTVREWSRETDEFSNLPDCTAMTLQVAGETFAISLNIEAVK